MFDFPSEGWMPVEPRDPDVDPFRERLMRAVIRTAGSDDLTWIDLPDYQNGHLAFLHIGGARSPLSVTMWMEESADRSARIIRFGPQRHVVELHNAHGGGVLEDPNKASTLHPVTAEERDVLERDAVSPAQIITASLTAETHARVWLERGELPERLRLQPLAPIS